MIKNRSRLAEHLYTIRVTADGYYHHAEVLVSLGINKPTRKFYDFVDMYCEIVSGTNKNSYTKNTRDLGEVVNYFNSKLNIDGDYLTTVHP